MFSLRFCTLQFWSNNAGISSTRVRNQPDVSSQVGWFQFQHSQSPVFIHASLGSLITCAPISNLCHLHNIWPLGWIG